jgi:putative transposase
MANTYTQLYVHLVFAVQGRESMIPRDFNEELHKYIGGVLSSKGDSLIEINSKPDHIHILIGFKPTRAIADIVRDVKSNSSRFVRQRGVTRGDFSWQEGYAAFTVSRSTVPSVRRYIRNQQEHHRQRTFRDEYVDMLVKADITFEPEFLFKFVGETDLH